MRLRYLLVGILMAVAATAHAQQVSGSGTANQLPKFSARSAIGSSQISDTGSLITIPGITDLSTATLKGASPLVLDGATADSNKTTVTVTDPTHANVFTIPNADTVSVAPTTCSGTDKVSGISVAGVITCDTDSGSGGLSAPWSQSSVTITGAATAVLDMSAAATLKVPASAGAAPTAVESLAYDSTAKTLVFGDATATHVVADDKNTPAMPSTSGATKFLTYNDTTPLTGLDVLAIPLPAADLTTPIRTRGISFPIGDPGGSALSAASTTTFYITVPFACTISAYNLVVDAGTVTVKFWKKATGTAIPTSSDSISTSGVSISSGTAIHSTTVSDFTTTTVTANDILAMNVTAVSTAKFVNGVLQCDMN